jgi:hypothetical protein
MCGVKPAHRHELVSGRARSLQELAKRDGISRRYIRRLIGLAFLSPELVEAILQGRPPVALTARIAGVSNDARPRLRYPDRCQPTQERSHA